jgi:hypothetical protein
MHVVNLLKAILILTLASLVLLSECGDDDKEGQVVEGDTVRIHYTLTLEDGIVRETSEDGDPWEFTTGACGAIEGFDQAVIGRKVGGSKTVIIPPDEAYACGPEAVFSYPSEGSIEPRYIIPLSFVDRLNRSSQALGL